MFILTPCSLYTKLVFPNSIILARRKSWELCLLGVIMSETHEFSKLAVKLLCVV